MLINPEKQSIPREFIENLPEGFKITNRKGAIYVVVDDLRCPNGHNLISDTVRIHGEPAIAIRVKGGGVKGTMYLDPFWGLHQKLFDFMFKGNAPNPLIKASCPECNISLMVKKQCESEGCTAEEFIEFALPGGKNKIEVCARWGCPEHRINIGLIPGTVAEAVAKINYPEPHTHSEAAGF
jgi:hypothetical protein